MRQVGLLGIRHQNINIHVSLSALSIYHLKEAIGLNKEAIGLDINTPAGTGGSGGGSAGEVLCQSIVLVKLHEHVQDTLLSR